VGASGGRGLKPGTTSLGRNGKSTEIYSNEQAITEDTDRFRKRERSERAGSGGSAMGGNGLPKNSRERPHFNQKCRDSKGGGVSYWGSRLGWDLRNTCAINYNTGPHSI